MDVKIQSKGSASAASLDPWVWRRCGSVGVERRRAFSE